MSAPYTLHLGDSREVLKTLPDNSVDAIVTDPPYEMGFMGRGWDRTGAANDIRIWSECLRVLKPGGHLLAFSGTRTYHRMACAIEDAGFELRDQIGWLYGSGMPKSRNIAKYDLEGDDAERWKGWGTALKPAWEPIAVARKPLDGTVAANVLHWDTGALNIDACRIGTSKDVPASVSRAVAGNSLSGSVDGSLRRETGDESGHNPNVGRWPANLIHDGSDEVLAAFAQYGEKTSGKPCGVKAGGQGNAFGHFNGGIPVTGFGDTGTAARFFYCAKASRTDRNEGCEHMERKPLHWSSGDQNPGSFQAEGTDKTSQNNHPTVKPTNLMAYLCRLVTPPGGVVLDPFMGSGSTGKACMREGFRFIGIDLTPEYVEIALARIEHEFTKQTPIPAVPAPQMDLFGDNA